MSVTADFLQILRSRNRLNLNLRNPGWDDYRGYHMHKIEPILYFPVIKKYLPDNPAEMRVLVGGTPQIVAQGRLTEASSIEDGKYQFELAVDQGMAEEQARYMIFDKRSGKPRKSRYKLIVEHVYEYSAPD